MGLGIKQTPSNERPVEEHYHESRIEDSKEVLEIIQNKDFNILKYFIYYCLWLCGIFPAPCVG